MSLASHTVRLPPFLRRHSLAVPHGGDPLAPLAQRAPRVLGEAVVHARLLSLLAVELVAEEEHLPRLRLHLVRIQG